MSSTPYSVTVLIVDDNPMNSDVLSYTLEEAGYGVRVESDGRNVLDQVKTYSPDLILLDVMLPGISGFELCKQLKEQAFSQAIPIIFMTASDDPTDKIRGLSLGAVDYITKPFQQEEVLARVRIHLQLGQLTQTLEAQNGQLKQLTEQLEQRVAERTAELSRSLQELKVTQTQLTVANTELEEYANTLEQKVEERTQQLKKEIYERQQVTEALRELNQELEVRVEQRTADLHQSQEYLKQLTENIESVFWITDPDKNQMLYVSPAYEHIWGAPLEELYHSPKNWLMSIHSDDRDRVIAAFPKQIRGEYSEEYRIIRSDGQQRWIRDRAFPIQNAAGQIYRIAGIAEDITEYKQTEEKLRLQERAIAASHNGIVIADARLPDNPVIYVNLAFERITGYTAAEVIGRNCRFLQGADINQPGLKELRTALQNQQGCRVSLRNYRKDGSAFWNELSIAPMYDDQGNLTHYIGIQSDISDRRLAESELTQRTAETQEANRFLYSVIDNMPAMLFIKETEELRFVRWNQAAEDLVGLSEADVLGKTDYDFFDQEQADFFTARDLEVIAQNQLLDIPEEPIRTLHKGLRYLHTRKVPICDEAGQPKYLLGMAEDITERKQTEERLKTATLRLSTLLQNLQAGILVEDETRSIVLVNQAFCTLFDLAILPEALIGAKCQDAGAYLQELFPAPDHFLERVEDILADRQTVIGEEITLVDGRVLERDYIPIIAEEDYRGHLWQYKDVTDRKRSKEALQDSNALLEVITEAQSQFITKADTRSLFDSLLTSLLELTQSEYGFIGEVLFTQDGAPYMEEAYMKMRGKPYLKAHAITNIAWSEETRAFYDAHAPGGMEFHNLATLFGAVMTTGETVIANDPTNDPRRGGLPDGHPPLNAFLGVPFYSDRQMVGMVGIANRPGGYDKALVDYLQPFLATCSNIIEAYRNDKRRQQAEQSLKQQLAAVEAAIDGIAILDAEGRYIYLNTAHLQLFGYEVPDDLLGQTWYQLYYPEEIERFQSELFPILGREGHWQGEATAKRRDGSTFAEEVSLTSIEGGGLVCVCRDVTDRKQAEEQLKSSLQEKDILLKEIHHRVKNNLLVVSSLLDWQIDYVEDPIVTKIIEESQNRIQSMALIHEKLYQSQNLAKINLGDYLESLANQLLFSFNLDTERVTLHFDLDPILLSIETVTPCGLIFSELISNVFEHAFTDNRLGQLWLSVKQDENRQVTIMITDDGVGLPEDCDIYNTESMGFQLVCLLTQQLEGEIKTYRDNGTTFILTFSELNYRKRI